MTGRLASPTSLAPKLFNLLESATFCLRHKEVGKEPGADCAEPIEPKSFRSADSLQKCKECKAHQKVRTPVEGGSKSFRRASYLQRVNLSNQKPEDRPEADGK